MTFASVVVCALSVMFGFKLRGEWADGAISLWRAVGMVVAWMALVIIVMVASS